MTQLHEFGSRDYFVIFYQKRVMTSGSAGGHDSNTLSTRFKNFMVWENP
jgi:hypothetical protein